MAVVTSIQDLAQKVNGLSLQTIAEKYPDCHPAHNPFDLYRAHLTNVLGEITGVDTSIIYSRLAWTQTLDKGDLTLPVPALRVKAKKMDELAQQWADKVGKQSVGEAVSGGPRVLTLMQPSSPGMTPFSTSRKLLAPPSPSSSSMRLSSRLSSP
jgi:hypothetical protein